MTWSPWLIIAALAATSGSRASGPEPAADRDASFRDLADRVAARSERHVVAWGETPLAATVRQFGVGSIFSSPLVVHGVVFFGSADGTLYALQ